jgi:dihydrofolate reductase
MKTLVYVATSLDGYIAGPQDELSWLIEYPNPEQSDFGFAELMNRIDALLMGRKTFEFVFKTGMWPYTKPVYVLSSTLNEIPKPLEGKAFLIEPQQHKPLLDSIAQFLESQGVNTLYIDGGQTIHTFISQNKVDELVITRVPIILGAGTPLFPNLSAPLSFMHIQTETFSNGLTKSTYCRAATETKEEA